MAGKLKGKVVLVTGGSRGIGAAIAKALGSEGASVAISYVSSSEKAESIVSEIKSKGVRAKAFQADQGNLEEVDALVTSVASHFGSIDILVNNAAILTMSSFDDSDENSHIFDRMYAVNLHGVLATIRAAVKIMKEGSRIITIGSVITTHSGFPGFADYEATKAAIVGYSKGAAYDLAQKGITINVLQSGVVETDMAQGSAVKKETFLSSIALRRFGLPEEIAAGVVFLASPEASYVTGAVLNIDGGYSA